MKIIAFVGMPASGKSEASSVAESLSIPVVNMGDIVREETAKRGLLPTDENIGGTGTELRKKEGSDIIARRCVPKIQVLDSQIVVVDGIRNIEEINFFKEQFGNDFKLIAIHAPTEERFLRVKKRSRSDDMSFIEDLKKRDEREKSWGLDKAIKIADITLINIRSLEIFKDEIEKQLQDL
ncbi:MAG: flagellar hook-basal body complex protein FliE [Candidatus Methanoperedens sp.]|nr:flagellar hook-basal body complex protein FliE [Candidatus Methanoperedens sp.]